MKSKICRNCNKSFNKADDDNITDVCGDCITSFFADTWAKQPKVTDVSNAQTTPSADDIAIANTPTLQSLRDLYENDDIEIVDADTVRIGEIFFTLCQNCAQAVGFMGHPICIECATDIANAMDAEPDNPDMQTIEYGEIARSISEYLYGTDIDDDDTAEDEPIG